MKKILLVLLMVLCSCSNKENIDDMTYDFKEFRNVEIAGIDISKLSEDELSVLYTQAMYCNAMCNADIDKLKQIVSEESTFTHMSGKTQSRDEYFRDIETGKLDYHRIGIDYPEITIDGDDAYITFTSVLDADAYGAKGVYRIKGTHHYRKIDEVWINVNN